MNKYIKEKYLTRRCIYIIYAIAFLCLTSCNHDLDLITDADNSSINASNQISVGKDNEDKQAYSYDYSVNDLAIIIPDEWTDKYYTKISDAIYFNGEYEYPYSSVSITDFILLPDLVNQQSIVFMNIVTFPKSEIMGY